jgi:hypothetical protein
MYARIFNFRLCAMVFSFSCTEGVAPSAKHEGQRNVVYSLIHLHYISGGQPMVPFTEHESDTFE